MIEKKQDILIVDDRPENLYALEKTLGDERFNIVKALSGEEALKLVLKTQFSLILLDVQMPGMDGYEVAELLSSSKRTKGIPIIFITAINKEKKHMLRGFSAGGVDYIPKPVDPEVLLSKVNIFCELFEQKRQVEKAKEELQHINDHLEETVMQRTQELEISKELAERSLSIKEEFLANMSHEIRTPVNAILGFTRLLIKSDMTDEQMEELNAVLFSSEQLLSIINDILDFSKIEAGKLELEKVPMDLKTLLQQSLKMQEPMANQKGLDLTLDIQDGIPALVDGDPTRLKQVITNLLNNALKFTEKGKVGVSAKVLSQGSNGHLLEIRVSDSGIGVPAEKLDTIFESFSQANSDTTRKFGGTGLGLTIVKRLVELHEDGAIRVESELDKGSNFIITMRLKESQESLDQTAEKVEVDMKALEGRLILLAEDNRLNQMVAKKVLGHLGAEVDIAENGVEAVSMSHLKAYDVVLMDIQMPDLDGYSATKQIRQNPKTADLIVVALTADVTQGVAKKCIEFGLDAYMSKPFTEEELLTKLGGLMKAKNESPVIPMNEIAPMKMLTNIETLSEMAGGSEEFIQEMISMYLEDVPEAMSKVAEALSVSDAATIKGQIHKIKPSMGFMGMMEMQELAARIENHAAIGNCDDRLRSMLDEFNGNLEISYVELQERLESLKKAS